MLTEIGSTQTEEKKALERLSAAGGRYLHAADCDCGTGAFREGRDALACSGGGSDVVHCHVDLV